MSLTTLKRIKTNLMKKLQIILMRKTIIKKMTLSKRKLVLMKPVTLTLSQ
jgi:hypothetical protein